MKFNAKLKVIRGRKDPIGQHSAQPLKYLIKEYGMKFREARVNARNFKRIINLKHCRNYVLMCEGSTASKAAQEVI